MFRRRGRRSSMSELHLGELEVLVLNWLWRTGELDAKTLHRQLLASRRISLSTVQSTLERLYRKHLLHRRKCRHAFIYRPAQSRTEVMGRLVETVVERFADGYMAPVLSSFLDVAERVDERTLDELERLIRFRRQRRDEEGEV